jgi:hypothetical protein
MPSADPSLRLNDLRFIPGTPEYDEEQAMWRKLNAARHEVMSFLGTSPKIDNTPDDFCATA